jgi:hypothetical protein
MYTCQLIIYMYNLQSTKPTPLQSHFPFQSEEKFVCKKGDNQYFIGVSWPDQHNSPIINANEAKCEDWLKLMDTYEKILSEFYTEAHSVVFTQQYLKGGG